MQKERSHRSAALVAMMVGLLAVSAAPAAAAPDGQGGGAHFRIAWLANDPLNTYDNAILEGILEVTAKSHSTVQPFFAGFDPGTQLAQCQSALGSGLYDALIVMAASPTDIEPCVAAAHAAGVPVVATDLPIGPDPTTVEPQMPGEVAASFLPASYFGDAVASIVPSACAGLDPCNILYVAGLLSFPVDQYGLAAIEQAAAVNPSIHLVVQGEAYYDTVTARQVVDDALDAHPEINVVIASGDQMALGAEQAGQDRGVVLRILGAGAGDSAIDAVREGRWFGTLNALPRTEGEISAELLVHALRDRHAAPVGVNPVEASGLPVWWTQSELALHPDFMGEWPGP